MTLDFLLRVIYVTSLTLLVELTFKLSVPTILLVVTWQLSSTFLI